MFLSRWSVRRPIAMTSLIIILVMIGCFFYPKLSIDLLPNMEIPVILVRCTYEGASPTEIEIEVASDDAQFVEEQLAKWREEILKSKQN